MIRFQSNPNPNDYQLTDSDSPCTRTGYVGSDKYLIPEYQYVNAQTPSAGAIFKIDSDGNEIIVGYWDCNLKRFRPVV